MKFCINKKYHYRSGIYQIKCLKSNKIYIGSTCGRKGFKGRFWGHFERLNNNTHWNPHLQNAWNKYGPSNFIFKIIKLLPHKCDNNMALYTEQKYLNKAFKTPQEIYNLSPIALGGNRIGKSKYTPYKKEIIKLRKNDISYKKIVKILQEKYKLNCQWISVRNFFINFCGGKFSNTRGKFGRSKFTPHIKIIKKLIKNNSYKLIIYTLRKRGVMGGCESTLHDFCYKHSISLNYNKKRIYKNRGVL